MSGTRFFGPLKIDNATFDVAGAGVLDAVGDETITGEEGDFVAPLVLAIATATTLAAATVATLRKRILIAAPFERRRRRYRAGQEQFREWWIAESSPSMFSAGA